MRRVLLALAAASLATACVARSEQVDLPAPEARPAIPEPPDVAPPPEPARDTAIVPADDLPAPAADPPEVVWVFAAPDRLERWSTVDGAVLGEVARFDDPDDFGDEGEEPVAGGSFLDEVRVGPDGTVLVTTCCEPAVGATFRVDPGSGELARVADGDDPAISPGGRLAVAPAGVGIVTILDPGGPIEQATLDLGAAGPDVGRVQASQLVWAPDDRHLAAVVSVDGQRDEVWVLDTAADDPGAEARRYLSPAGVRWSSPAFRRDGQLLVVEQTPEGDQPARGVVLDTVSGRVVGELAYPGRVASQRYDATFTWLLVVGEDGALTWQGLGRNGTLADAGVLGAAW